MPEPTGSPAKPAASTEAPSESEIDSPNALTLTLLFVVFVVTVGAWGAARFACNMHPPESRGAPKLPTERLIMTPKDAAIEFVQRWRSHDFDGAVEIVNGELLSEMQRAKADCAAKANECARQREASAGRLTTAVVLRQDGFRADARVTTLLKGSAETYRVTLSRQDSAWKATNAKPE